MKSKEKTGQKMKRQGSVPKHVADFLDVPLPAVCSVPRIELYGDREFSIEGAAGIIEYDENQICIATSDRIVRVIGSGLNITLLNDKNMTVTGIVLSIEFIS